MADNNDTGELFPAVTAAENDIEILSKVTVGNDVGTTAVANVTTAKTTTTLVIGITDFELWLQLVVFYLIMAAIAGTTLNSYVGACIIKSKKLRSRFYAIACFWMFTRATMGFQYLFISSYRILRTLNVVSAYQLQITCHSFHMFIYYSGVSEIYLLVFMVIDRIIAIGKPNWYRLLTIRQAVLTSIAIEVANVFINLIPSYIGMNPMAVIQCLNVLSPVSAWFGQYHEQEPIVLTAILVALQLTAIGLTWFKMREIKRQSSETEQAIFLKRQVALMTALRNMVFGHAGLTVLTRLLLFFAGIVPSQSARLVAYGGMVQTFDVFTGPMILLWSKKELRRACTPRCSVGVEEDDSRTFRVGPTKSVSQTNGATTATLPN